MGSGCWRLAGKARGAARSEVQSGGDCGRCGERQHGTALIHLHQLSHPPCRSLLSLSVAPPFAIPSRRVSLWIASIFLSSRVAPPQRLRSVQRRCPLLLSTSARSNQYGSAVGSRTRTLPVSHTITRQAQADAASDRTAPLHLHLALSAPLTALSPVAVRCCRCRFCQSNRWCIAGAGK